MSAKELKVIIKTDAKTGELKVYQGEMAKVVKRVDDFRKNTERSLSAMEKFANRMRNMAHIGAALYAIKQMSDVVVGFGANIVNTAAEFEKLQSILKTLDGSKAKESFEWIKNFTKNTPYELAEVTEAFIKLKAYGLDAKKELKTLGDTAAAMGKPLDQAVEAIADAVNGEFERLKEFGIKASLQGDKVALKWIDASGRMRNAVIENNSKIIDSTIQAIWNEKYAGAMDKLSNTFSGKISNLKDSWASFTDKLAKDSGIFDTAKRFVSKLTEKIDELTKSDRAIREFGAAFKSTAKLIVWSVSIISKAIVGWIELMVTAKAVKDALFKAANTGWEQLKQRFEYFLGWLANDPKKMAYHKKQWDKLQKEWESGIGAIGDELKESISGFDRLLRQFDSLEDLLDDTTEKGKRGVKEIGEAGEEASKHISNISSSFEKVGKAVDENQEKLVKYTQAYITYLESTGKKTEAFWIKEGEKLRRLYEAGIGGDKLQEVMEADYKKFLESIEDKSRNSIKTISDTTTSVWDSTTRSMALSMQQNFFDYMTGRFRSFKDFMKNILNDMLSNLVTPFAKGLSNLLSNALFGAFRGAQGGIVNNFLVRAGLTTGATSVGAYASQLGLKLVGDVYKGTVNGHEVVISKTGEVLQGGSSLPTDILSGLSALNSAKSLYTALSSGGIGNALQNIMYAPAAGVAQIGTYLQSIPFVGETLSQGAYGLSILLTGGNPSVLGTAGMAGATLGAGVLGYLGGKALDSLFGADTHAGTGGSIGAAIGTLIAPGIGSIVGGLLGSVLGGLFGKTKVTGTAKGIDIFGLASSDNVAGRYWGRTDYKKKSWFSSKRWSEWRYKGFDKQTIKAIEKTIGTFDHLLWQMGYLDKTLKVKGGRFSSIEQFLSTNVVKEFLKEVMGLGQLYKTATVYVKKTVWQSLGYFGRGYWKTITVATKKAIETEDKKKLDEIYQIWVDYAKSINKKVYEAFSDVVNEYIQSKRGFQGWYFQFKGMTKEYLEFQKKIAEQDLELIRKTIGQSAYGVDIENYIQKYEKAVKQNFTPETIKQWKALGEALMKAAEAEKKYEESLKQSTKTVNGIVPKDMLLGYALNTTQVNVDALAQEIREGNSETKLLFFAILKELKKQTALQQGLEL